MTIYDLCLLGFDEEAQTARILALTGSGTYLRVLAEDLGAALGVGGYARALSGAPASDASVWAMPWAWTSLSPERYANDWAGSAGPRSRRWPACRRGVGRQSRRVLLPTATRSYWTARVAFRVYGQERLLGIYEGQGGVARPLVIFPAEVTG